MARSGAQKDRESGYRASLLGNSTEVAPQAILALLLTRYLHVTPSLACWANERASDHMVISSSKARQCAARRQAGQEEIGPAHGVFHRGQEISAARWSRVAGQLAGIDTGKGMFADERLAQTRRLGPLAIC